MYYRYLLLYVLYNILRKHTILYSYNVENYALRVLYDNNTQILCSNNYQVNNAFQL